MSHAPTQYQRFRTRYRAVAECYERLAEVCHELGPLSAKVRVLVKLGMAIGVGHEGAVHAHTRLAREAGWADAAIRHVALLATTTLGFPAMMRAHALVEDVLTGEGRAAQPRPRSTSRGTRGAGTRSGDTRRAAKAPRTKAPRKRAPSKRRR